MSRSKGMNFSGEEEIQLCRSYLDVGKNPVHGTSQTSATFWEKLTQHFNAARPDGSEVRPYRSLECKRSIAQHDVAKFCGSVAFARDLNESGTNAEDEIQRAQQHYQEIHVTRGAKDNKPFKFLHCWRILACEPKWQDYCVVRHFRIGQPRHRVESSTANITDSSALSAARPPGNKAAKAAADVALSALRTNKRMAEAMDRMARAGEKRVRAMEEANNLLLFTAPLDTLDPDAREYIQLRCSRALARLRDEEDLGEPSSAPKSSDDE